MNKNKQKLITELLAEVEQFKKGLIELQNDNEYYYSKIRARTVRKSLDLTQDLAKFRRLIYDWKFNREEL